MATELRFVDSNVFVRHLTHDDPRKARACEALFEAIEMGRVSAWTSGQVVAEVVWVLNSARLYAVDRASIRRGLLPLLEMGPLRLELKSLYRPAFDLYVRLSIDFVDAFHAVWAQSRAEPVLYSYDHDFDKVGGIQRLEPGEEKAR